MKKNTKNIPLCRKLRQHQTKAEQILWRALRNRSLSGYKFKRQYSIPPYVVDFYCDELKLAIEVDGYIHSFDNKEQKDKARQKHIESKGIKVIRYFNTNVKEDLDEVLLDILHQCQSLINN